MSMTQDQINLVNAYAPVFLPDGAVSETGYGDSEPVDGIYCLTLPSLSGLKAALTAMGIQVTSYLDDPWPVPAGSYTFNIQVPWLKFPPSGAIVNAGLMAEYFNHGVHPFVGSSEETGLLADINYRILRATQGTPWF